MCKDSADGGTCNRLLKVGIWGSDRNRDNDKDRGAIATEVSTETVGLWELSKAESVKTKNWAKDRSSGSVFVRRWKEGDDLGESKGLERGQHSCLSALFMVVSRNILGNPNVRCVWWEIRNPNLQCERWKRGSSFIWGKWGQQLCMEGLKKQQERRGYCIWQLGGLECPLWCKNVLEGSGRQRQMAGRWGGSQGKDGMALKAISTLQTFGVKTKEKSK